jgi:hypothetical protein
MTNDQQLAVMAETNAPIGLVYFERPRFRTSGYFRAQLNPAGPEAGVGVPGLQQLFLL